MNRSKLFSLCFTVVLFFVALFCVVPGVLRISHAPSRYIQIPGDDTSASFMIPEGKYIRDLSSDELLDYRLAPGTVDLPMKFVQRGPMPWHFDAVPQAFIVSVDLRPVVRTWSKKDDGSFNATHDDLIYFRTKESILMAFPVTIQYKINEANIDRYFKTYGSMSIASVGDLFIRPCVSRELTDRFRSMTVEECEANKYRIFSDTKDVIAKQFEPLGIEILVLLPSGSLLYQDPDIQAAESLKIISRQKLEAIQNAFEAQECKEEIARKQALYEAESAQRMIEESAAKREHELKEIEATALANKLKDMADIARMEARLEILRLEREDIEERTRIEEALMAMRLAQDRRRATESSE